MKQQFSEDQYYHSRERYFPEQSYHAAGAAKYPVETTEDLTEHALAQLRKHKKKKPSTAEPAAEPVEKTAEKAKPGKKSTKAKAEPLPFQHSKAEQLPVPPFQHSKGKKRPRVAKASKEAKKDVPVVEEYHRW